MRYTVVLIREQEGGFSASVPAMPGCFSQGDTLEEALANVSEAMDGWLESEAIQGRSPLEEDRQIVLDGIAQALDIVQEMRDAGEIRDEWAEDLRLASVSIERAVAA